MSDRVGLSAKEVEKSWTKVQPAHPERRRWIVFGDFSKKIAQTFDSWLAAK